MYVYTVHRACVEVKFLCQTWNRRSVKVHRIYTYILNMYVYVIVYVCVCASVN